MDKLKQLRDLLSKATPGPWSLIERCSNAKDDEACGVAGPSAVNADGRRYVQRVFASDAYDECSHPVSLSDARLIAASHNALDALLSIAEAAVAYRDGGQRAADIVPIMAALSKLEEP